MCVALSPCARSGSVRSTRGLRDATHAPCTAGPSSGLSRVFAEGTPGAGAGPADSGKSRHLCAFISPRPRWGCILTRTREPACRAASCLPSGAALLMPHPPPAPRPGCPFVCALSCATPGLHRRCDTLVPAAARPVPSLSAPHAHPGGSCTLFFSSNFRNSVSGSERAAACPVLGCTSRR